MKRNNLILVALALLALVLVFFLGSQPDPTPNVDATEPAVVEQPPSGAAEEPEPEVQEEPEYVAPAPTYHSQPQTTRKRIRLFRRHR